MQSRGDQGDCDDGRDGSGGGAQGADMDGRRDGEENLDDDNGDDDR